MRVPHPPPIPYIYPTPATTPSTQRQPISTDHTHAYYIPVVNIHLYLTHQPPLETLLTPLHELLTTICHNVPTVIPQIPTDLTDQFINPSPLSTQFGPPDYDIHPSAIPSPLTQSQALYARKLYGDIVITYMDRDLECPFLSCPSAYWQALYDTFCMDQLYYMPCDDLTPDLLLRRYANQYINHGWSRYFPIQPTHKRCIPGPARIIFKRKDTDIGLPRIMNPRARPIVPYRNKGRKRQVAHPLQQGLRLASTTLSLLMSRCPTKAWSLPSTQDLSQYITNIHNDLLQHPDMDINYTLRCKEHVHRPRQNPYSTSSTILLHAPNN
jgi:hypothetical protein